VSPLYLYAVLAEAPTAPLGQGLAGEPLRLVSCGPLAGVVGAMPAQPAIEPAALRGHDATIRRLAGLVDAILPARFATLAEDEAALRALLEPRTATLGDALRLVAGCEQMTLRVFGSALPAPTGATDVAENVGPGTRYLTARLRATTPAGLEPVRAAVAALVRAERIAPHRTPPLLASLYHLVSRGGAAAYLNSLAAAREAIEPLRVESSGPWPPYGFAPGLAAELVA
jgi:hypothetical protein